ncbi:hypothetical protein H4S07_004018, partial [Coemansia furcata]
MHFKFRHMSDPQQCVRAAISTEPLNARQQEAMKFRRDSHQAAHKIPCEDIENGMTSLKLDNPLYPVKPNDGNSHN